MTSAHVGPGARGGKVAHGLRWLAAVSATILSNLVPSLCPAQQFPRPVGYVNDFAQVIPEEWEAEIEAICTELEQKTGAEIAVVTVGTIGDEDYREYANRLFEAWGIGKKGKDNGVLLFDAVKERKFWIEIGYGLEPVINDARAGDIFRQVIRPLLREDRYGEALYNGVLEIARIIAEAEGVKLQPRDVVGISPPRETGASGTRGLPLPEILILLLLLSFIGFGLGSGRRRFRSLGPWWWGWGSGGGFGGGFGGGGFGGGFGGFGGGASGGGGAGGGY